MLDYLFIASDDPLENHRTTRMRELAISLRGRGGAVSVFLVQNAVLGARQSCWSRDCDVLLAENIDVIADDFSLRERGMSAKTLMPGVRVASMEAVIMRLAHGWKVLWS